MARYSPILLASLLIFALLAGSTAGAQTGWPAETAASEPAPTEAPLPTDTPALTLEPSPTEAPKPPDTPAPTLGPSPTTAPPAGKRTYLPLLLAVRPPLADHFWAERYRLALGECTSLHWSVTNAQEIYLDNVPVTGQETRRVCPATTTKYVLRVVRANITVEHVVMIAVDAGTHPVMEFWADATQVERGGCTVLHWRVTEAVAVYLNSVGVAGESTLVVCPTADTTYVLRVKFANGAAATWRLTITVVPITIPTPVATPSRIPSLIPLLTPAQESYLRLRSE